MRRALSLIELIFTIVIIAIVFTVIPKIVLSLNKASSFSSRQDAIFNGVSMIKMISRLPWDQNNTDNRDILHVNNGNFLFKCDENTTRRRGAFVGGRTCEDNLSTSAIGYNSELNDIGDFDGYDENTSNFLKYGINIKVKYIEDNISYIGQTATIVLKTDINSADTTNLKYVDINITYQGKRGKKDTNLVQFNYASANIGQMIINKRFW